MNYTIEKDIGEAAYLQLYRQLRGDITDGVLPYGTRLPSKRLLSQELGISVVTAQHAYELLCDEGYAEARARSGFFVLYREEDGFARPAEREQPRHQMPPGGDEPFPFGVLARTARRVISEYGDALLIKSPDRGCTALREAVSAYLARSRGIRVSAEQIVIGSGAEYLYGLVVQLLGRERGFALEDPSYAKIRQVYEACGASCELLPLRSDGIDSAALRDCGAGVLHVTPFHSYPSGVTASASKRREYLRWARERQGFIVEDDFDSEFTVSTKAEDTLFSLDPCGPVIYINTFSETVAPSVRVGYMVLSEPLLREFCERLGFYSCTVPVFDQLLLAELIRSGDFERHINRVRRRKRREAEKRQNGTEEE